MCCRRQLVTACTLSPVAPAGNVATITSAGIDVCVLANNHGKAATPAVRDAAAGWCTSPCMPARWTGPVRHFPVRLLSQSHAFTPQCWTGRRRGCGRRWMCCKGQVRSEERPDVERLVYLGT